MEKMPYRRELDTRTLPVSSTESVTTDWQQRLPVLSGKHVALRELRASDAHSLLALLTTEEVTRFISPPPTTVEGFEQFIAWTHQQRTAGTYICYAVTIQGFDTAIGIFQVRQHDPNFATAEWGFVLGSPFWGTGVFKESAELVAEFVFDILGTHRLEARAAVPNGRGNGALLKMGAVQECVLRRSFVRDDRTMDQVLYAILEDDWRAMRSPAPVRTTIQTRVH